MRRALRHRLEKLEQRLPRERDPPPGPPTLGQQIRELEKEIARLDAEIRRDEAALREMGEPVPTRESPDEYLPSDEDIARYIEEHGGDALDAEIALLEAQGAEIEAEIAEIKVEQLQGGGDE